jgi:hypothetical protein
MIPKRKKKLVFSSVSETIDGYTGKMIQETTTNVVAIRQEPQFVKVYLNDLNNLLQLPTSCTNISYALLQIMGYDGTIRLTMATKVKISATLGITEGSFKNYLTQLVKAGVLFRSATSEYEMNPHLFAKGHWNEIHKRREDFELKIRYKSNGSKTIEGNFCINDE